MTIGNGEPFGPDMEVTRGEAADYFVRLWEIGDHRFASGSPLWAPDPQSSTRFGDSVDHPQVQAIATAGSSGMMTPRSESMFGVDDPVTFAETAAAFYQFAVMKQLPLGWDSHPLTPYVDNRIELNLVWSPDGARGAVSIRTRLFLSDYDEQVFTQVGTTWVVCCVPTWRPGAASEQVANTWDAPNANAC